MRTFDYYCFVGIEKDLETYRMCKKIIKISKKVLKTSNLKLRKEIKEMNFITLEDFLKRTKKYVKDFGKEIDYYEGLYSIGNHTFFGMNKREIEEAIKKGKFLVYDQVKDAFLNIFGCEVDISGKNIFPRTIYSSITKKIEQMGATGINTFLEEEKLENWFLYIEVDRDICLTTLRELIENPTLLEKYKINNTIFLKTVEKKFSDVCRIRRELEPPYNLRFEELNKVDNLCTSIDEIDLDEQIIISKPVTPTKDEYGLREWRVFVIDNELQSISRRDVNKSIEIEDKVLKLANKKIEQNTGKIPSNYVMDIMEYIDEYGNLKLDIVEFNTVMNAWAFFDNNIVYGNSDFDKLDNFIDESSALVVCEIFSLFAK